jgi:hypothetical protein
LEHESKVDFSKNTGGASAPLFYRTIPAECGLHTLIYTLSFGIQPLYLVIDYNAHISPKDATGPRFWARGFNATRGTEECLKEHGINRREEESED